MEKITYRLGGMACPDCSQKLGLILERQQGVRQASIAYATGKAKIEYNPEEITVEGIEQIIGKAGYKILARR